MTAPTDFDLHGLAGIRLVDATEDDVAMVKRQVGLNTSTLSGEPDIFIRFVDRLPVSSRLLYLGVDDVGFTDDAFLVLRGKQKSRARVQVPFDRIGQCPEIVCERGLLQIPLLIPILNLTVLSKGALPLHASAFTYDGVGWIATGWSKGGKTETLLSFMVEGATYIGDEWVYLTGDGRRMYGIPEPIRVWDWHLDHLPRRYRALVRRADRARLRMLQFVAGGIDRMTSGRSTQRSFAARNLNRVKPLLGKQMHVDIEPGQLFGQAACRLSGVPEKILFVATHEASDVTVRPLDPDEIAARMVSSLQFEQMNFMSYYWKFCFAFPERTNALVESSRDLQREILKRVLKGKQAYEVCHPYPVAIHLLFDAVNEQCLRT